MAINETRRSFALSAQQSPLWGPFKYPSSNIVGWAEFQASWPWRFLSSNVTLPKQSFTDWLNWSCQSDVEHLDRCLHGKGGECLVADQMTPVKSEYLMSLIYCRKLNVFPSIRGRSSAGFDLLTAFIRPSSSHHRLSSRYLKCGHMCSLIWR